MAGQDRLGRVLDATATVWVDGHRSGSAVLLDARHLLTAGHTLAATKPDSKVEIGFPGQADPTPVTVVRLPEGHGMDVAVLQLDQDAGRDPVLLGGSRRLPQTVQVVGFPLAEYEAKGVWRDFRVSGPSTAGTVQLDWTGEGSLVGQSGGPVVDDTDATLVGILVEGSNEDGAFDRFLPLDGIERVWPGVRRAWLFAGEDARGHAERRATGRRGLISGGDLFQGRAQALGALHGWLFAEQAPGRVLVVTGQPGGGKSAVICRSALDAQRSGSLGVFFHARQATAAEFLDAVAQLLGLADPGGNTDVLLAAMAGLGPSRPPVAVVVDALDEAASGQDRRVIAAALVEIARLPWLRVAVATRPLAAVDRYSPGHVLADLGVHSAADAWLVDLDADPYRDPAAVARFAGGLLTQDGFDSPGPPGAAWTVYRAHPATARTLASLIAKRAHGNFLVAALTAQPVSEAGTALDPGRPGFNPKDLPATIGEALDKYLDRLPEQQRVTSRALLTALAYARGDGISDDLWLGFVHALGYTGMGHLDIDALRAGTAADYLLTTSLETHGRLTRLFHQALIEELVAGRDKPRDEQHILHALVADVGAAGGWSRHPYGARYGADHGAAAGALDRLLHDTTYLATADMPRLAAVIEAQPAADRCPAAVAVRRCAHRIPDLGPDQRLTLLAVTAAHLGLNELRDTYNTASQPQRPAIAWAHSLGTPHRTLPHTDIVAAVGFGTTPDGTLLLASGSWDGSVRIWDPSTGQQLHYLTGHTHIVEAVAFGTTPDGTLLLASGSRDHSVRIWNPSTGQQLHYLTGHTNTVAAVAFEATPDGTLLLASCSRHDSVRIWNPSTGQQLHHLTGHTNTVAAVALGTTPDGTLLLASGSWDGSVRIWDPSTGQQLHHLTGHTDAVAAVAFGTTPDGTLLLASGSRDHSVRIWNPSTGQQLHHLTGHTNAVEAVAFEATPDGILLLASGSWDHSVRIWNPSTGQQLHYLTGHTDAVAAVAFEAAPDGILLLASGSWDHSVRIWNPSTGQQLHYLTGHTGIVAAVAFEAAPDGTLLLASGSWDRSVRIWDPSTGQQLHHLTGHTNWVEAVAFGTTPDGTLLLASGSRDRSVRIWDPSTGQQLHHLTGHTNWVEAVAFEATPDGTLLLASGSRDDSVRIWDPSTGQQLHYLTGHTSIVAAVALEATPDGTLLLASGSHDRSVRIWNPSTGQQLHHLTGHTDAVAAVAFGTTPDGTLLLASGSWDGSVRIWDPSTGQQLHHLTGHTDAVAAVAFGTTPDGTLLLASGSWDGSVRIWDPSTGQQLELVATLEIVNAVTFGRPGELFAAMGRAAMDIRLPNPIT